MIEMKFKGQLDTSKWLSQVKNQKLRNILASAGERGVAALRANTPIGTGRTAQSWAYKVKQTDHGIKIVWYNTNINNGVPIAIVLQYGHGTRQGGYVQGRDYINPAMKPIFDEIDRLVERAVNG